MRTILLAAALTLLPCAAGAAPPGDAAQGAAPSPAKCDRFADLRHADGTPGRGPSVQRLDRLPPADVHLTVERRVGGCRQATIVAQGIGGPAFRGR